LEIKEQAKKHPAHRRQRRIKALPPSLKLLCTAGNLTYHKVLNLEHLEIKA
jgi:hypothetical protein